MSVDGITFVFFAPVVAILVGVAVYVFFSFLAKAIQGFFGS